MLFEAPSRDERIAVVDPLDDLPAEIRSAFELGDGSARLARNDPAREPPDSGRCIPDWLRSDPWRLTAARFRLVLEPLGSFDDVCPPLPAIDRGILVG